MNKQFKKDLKKYRDIMIYTTSGMYLHVKKKELREYAELQKINYYITNTVYVNERDVMIIT